MASRPEVGGWRACGLGKWLVLLWELILLLDRDLDLDLVMPVTAVSLGAEPSAVVAEDQGMPDSPLARCPCAA
jgi:hypothetical protein